MSVPMLFSKYAIAIRAFSERHRRKFLGALIVIAFAPAVLERLFQVGPGPGKVLFVFMLLFFAAVMPAFVFRKPLPHTPSSRGSAWAWARSVFCAVWVLASAWAIYSGLNG